MPQFVLYRQHFFREMKTFLTSEKNVFISLKKFLTSEKVLEETDSRDIQRVLINLIDNEDIVSFETELYKMYNNKLVILNNIVFKNKDIKLGFNESYNNICKNLFLRKAIKTFLESKGFDVSKIKPEHFNKLCIFYGTIKTEDFVTFKVHKNHCENEMLQKSVNELDYGQIRFLLMNYRIKQDFDYTIGFRILEMYKQVNINIDNALLQYTKKEVIEYSTKNMEKGVYVCDSDADLFCNLILMVLIGDCYEYKVLKQYHELLDKINKNVTKSFLPQSIQIVKKN